YGEPGWLFNLSVWESLEALQQYVYKGLHADMLKRKKEWFGEMEGPSYVLWWIPAGERPTLTEAKRRIALLRQHGPSPEAFSFQHRFPAGVEAPASRPVTPGGIQS
ncbi:DUF3291 domain-containing protein, partial [Glaesserella parasuis]|uniref:DUF3291 domain-containing protein n=1 Tax=Glaesserella parasuis TaxID=738 RepID=UPI003F2AC730